MISQFFEGQEFRSNPSWTGLAWRSSEQVADVRLDCNHLKTFLGLEGAPSKVVHSQLASWGWLWAGSLSSLPNRHLH